MRIYNWRKSVTVSEEESNQTDYFGVRYPETFFEARISARLATGETVEMSRVDVTYMGAMISLESALRHQGFELL